ncbi:Fc.00g003860.m01.CDS01 [Cosmosporella sp. VM-42]
MNVQEPQQQRPTLSALHEPAAAVTMEPLEPVSVVPAKRKPTPDDSDDTGSSSMPPSKSRKRIPSEEWEKKRPIIARLYQEEKKSLREVMEILQRDHQFSATVKMYKSRIWKWGLDKKLKSDEVLAILVLKSERDALKKPSQFTIRGQPVDLDNINRYIRRNPSLMARFRAGQMPSIQTTLEVQCRTPSPSPGRSLTPPTETHRVEEVLGLFKNYVDGSFASGAWDCEYNDYCVSQMPGDRSDELFERVIASFALVNRCMMRGDKISISAILNPAFESLKEIIANESPVFVVRTVCLLWYLDRHHKNDLLRLVMEYLAGLVPIVLGKNHIMSQIWKALGSTQFSDYYELSMALYSVLVPLLEERIGPANYLTAILYGDHIDCLFSRTRSAESLSVASRYRAKADATGKQHPWLTELAITQTALLCANKEAEGQIEEAMECLQTLKSYGMSEEQEAVVNIQLGNYSYQTGDIPLAVRSYREATRLAVTVDGDERLLLTCLANLESALSKQGKQDEADRVNRYRLNRISKFAKESSDFAKSTSTSKGVAASAIQSTNIITSDYELEGQDIPDWLWKSDDDDDNNLLKGMPRTGDAMQWLDLSMNPGGWTESTTGSLPETMGSHYPSLSPLLEDWEDRTRQVDEWNGSCYG